MLVTLLGMVIEVSPEQPSKAEPPMFVTLLGISTEESPEQRKYLQLIVFQLVLIKTVEK